jgi:perosamine synthetase
MITTGEGGMVTTNNADAYEKLKQFRNHGITTDPRKRTKDQTWYYEMVNLGFNYRITDFQCALGQSQLPKLSNWVNKRNTIANQYNELFKECESIQPLQKHDDREHSYHLYVVKIISQNPGKARQHLFTHLRQKGIGVNVHYLPVYLHPYYQEHLNFQKGLCIQAEKAYESILSLPIYPDMSEEDIQTVISATIKGLKF